MKSKTKTEKVWMMQNKMLEAMLNRKNNRKGKKRSEGVWKVSKKELEKNPLHLIFPIVNKKKPAKQKGKSYLEKKLEYVKSLPRDILQMDIINSYDNLLIHHRCPKDALPQLWDSVIYNKKEFSHKRLHIPTFAGSAYGFCGDYSEFEKMRMKVLLHENFPMKKLEEIWDELYLREKEELYTHKPVLFEKARKEKHIIIWLLYLQQKRNISYILYAEGELKIYKSYVKIGSKKIEMPDSLKKLIKSGSANEKNTYVTKMTYCIDILKEKENEEITSWAMKKAQQKGMIKSN